MFIFVTSMLFPVVVLHDTLCVILVDGFQMIDIVQFCFLCGDLEMKMAIHDHILRISMALSVHKISEIYAEMHAKFHGAWRQAGQRL
jgi:hypothetical protein